MQELLDACLNLKLILIYTCNEVVMIALYSNVVS